MNDQDRKSDAPVAERDSTTALGELTFPFELVKDRLAEVDRLISDQARAFDPGVEGYVSYVCEISGKRIRPALAVLAGGASGKLQNDHVKIGAIVELVHLATLVHDDVLDEATVRRLLDAGANASDPNGRDGWTPLIHLTSSLRGEFSDDPKTRSEFMDLIHHHRR